MLPAWSNGVVIGGKIPCSFIGYSRNTCHGDNDMFSLEIDCDPEDRDLLIAELWEQGSAGIVELLATPSARLLRRRVSRAALLELYPGSRAARGRGARLGAIRARSAAADGSGRALLSGPGVARRPDARRPLPHRGQSRDGVRHRRPRDHAAVPGSAGAIPAPRHARAGCRHGLGHSCDGRDAARRGARLCVRYGPGRGRDRRRWASSDRWMRSPRARRTS